MKNLILFCFIFYSLMIIEGCNENNDCNKALTWNEHIQQKCLIQLKSLLKDPDTYQSVTWKVVNNYPKYVELQKRLPDWDGAFYKWTFINEY